LDSLERLGELAADVDVAGLGADGMATDGASLDQRVRRPAHDLAILERPRLGFVGVADQVVRLAIAGLHEAPFHARWESSATASSQSGILDNRDDVGGRHAERLLQRLVSAKLLPA